MQVSSQKTSFPLEKYNYFSNVKKSVVYDITGSELGCISNIAYHPGLRLDFLVRKEGSRFLFPNYYVIPDACIGQCYKQSVVLGVPKDELSLVNYSGFHHLFLPYQIPKSKKRYVIVEAPVTTVRHYLDQREEVPKKASESESLFIEELNVTKDIKVRQFVKLFNVILATSPDTYIPLSQEDAQKYFKQGTFIATEHYQPIGYCTVSLVKDDKTNQNTGSIAGIGVHPSNRGRNVALALTKHSLKYMITNDVDTIQADIYEMNTPSLRLFRSLGFREVGEIFLA